MKEPNTDIGAQDKQAEQYFSDGFEQTDPAPKTATDKEPKSETAPKAEPEAKTPEPPAQAAPKYVQITEEQFASFQSAAAKTADFEAKFSKVFGTVGDLQQIIRKLQAETPSGAAIDISADAFAEMKTDYPELAEMTMKGMQRVLKGLRGTGQTAQPPASDAKPQVTVDPDAVTKAVNAAVEKLEIASLAEHYPDWRDIVGAADSEGKFDPNNPFRKWLATQPADYQTKVNGARNAAVIVKAIDNFKKSQTAAPKPTPKPDPAVAARTSRIKDAIQPRGDGGRPNPANTADDYFEQGFVEG